ncbi:protein LBH isoform X1 [Lates calcarifer]|uniref:Protein LBH isoform X1 n=2 Tax=Lates calcarifer TaxID=8187 RepID=A0AAJ8BLZ4_LATCA|nr:protein LBH isoform X1 [Lates calcarifer]
MKLNCNRSRAVEHFYRAAWMTEVMNSLEPGTEDFSGGGAGGDQGTIFPDTHERYPKLSKRLPSIVVEPTDGAEVESGELRWPPDEPSSPEAQTERQSLGEQTADEGESSVGVDEEASGAEMQDSN